MKDAKSRMMLLGRGAQVVVVLLCVALIAQSFALWSATGRERFTKNLVPSEQPAQEQAADDAGEMGDLFEETGINEGGETIEVTTERAFGLLPAAYPWRIWDPHFASVATIAGPAAVIAILVLILPMLLAASKPVAGAKADQSESPS